MQTDLDLSRQKVQKFYLHQAACMKVKMRRNYEWLELGRGMRVLSGLKKEKKKPTRIPIPPNKRKKKQAVYFCYYYLLHNTCSVMVVNVETFKDRFLKGTKKP